MSKNINKKRILLIHLGSYGDCVMVTTIARQIKIDYQGCYLTWCIADKYASVLTNNPDVDEVWVFPLLEGETIIGKGWERCKTEANKRQAAGEFDLIFLTQIYPDNVTRFDGTTRSSTFRNYPHPVRIPVTPIICLLPQEIEKVQMFAEKHRLSSFQHVILMECSPSSCQSVFNIELGLELSKQITENRKDVLIIISTHLHFVPPNEYIISANMLSFRENAALTHHCTLLVGCSSGITWVGTSSASKRINTIQFLSRNLGASFASVSYDFRYWNLSKEHIIESTTTNVDSMLVIVNEALKDLSGAKKTHHEALQPIFWGWVCFIDFKRGFGGVLRAYRTMFLFIRRNGISFRELLDLISLTRVLRAYTLKLKERVLERLIVIRRKL